MKIGIIGAGRLGCALGAGLNNKNFKIAGIYSKSPESSRFLNEKLNCNFENNIQTTIENSDMIFITVSDAFIETVACEIQTKSDSIDISKKTFLHCSGALSSDALTPIKSKGGFIGALHPIQTFADREDGYKGLDGICFGFEGDNEAIKPAQEIVNAFDGRILMIEKNNKPLYHAAGCILSNYVVTLTYLAENLFKKIGIEPDVGVKAFMPLMENTVKNIAALGSSKALTGPISRGDANVVESHIAALNEKSPEISEIYSMLGKIALEMAVKRGGIDSATEKKMKKILNI